ncbi:NAD-dependent epimerase/dehydratase family protein [Cohnella terricola]|uniref:NAD-dependent epimerase/dehydratase family protein n=1 Tax=Cohnella terricola TaxID=1289167 RepID=A0A559JQ72_9BACL|nr:NAD-dependent epimerase/dehydratase family protein [Cohnella terricola]TVY02032.1 NAD-dependent epimerase/dehydratase family protein [Cohnella terricola]
MTNVLVTGVTGFLGRAAAMRLRDMGWQVTGLGRDPDAGRMLAAQGIPFIQADLRNQREAEAACAGQEYVIHCAALSSPWGRYRDFYESNVTGTQHIVSGCLRHGVRRLVHVSTSSVYFDYVDGFNLSEEAKLPRKPANAYAATKLLAERIVTGAAVKGLSAIILRPRGVFGPGDNSLFPRLLHANQSRGIPLVGGGEAQLDLTYVDNVVEGLIRACFAPANAAGRIYNLTNGEPVKVIDLLSRVFGLLGIPLRTRSVSRPAALAAGRGLEWLYRVLPWLGHEPPFTRYTVGLLAFSQTLDISQSRRLLQYEPHVRLDDGLRRFAAWRRSGKA